MRYTICPVMVFNDPQQVFDNYYDAREHASNMTRKYGEEAGGFVILEIKPLGRFEFASPVWISMMGEDVNEPGTKESPANKSQQALVFPSGERETGPANEGTLGSKESRTA